MPQMPGVDLQVSTERICTESMPAFSILVASSSSINPPAARMTSPFSGLSTSFSTVRPRMRSANGTTISPPSITALVVMPSVVPQS